MNRDEVLRDLIYPALAEVRQEVNEPSQLSDSPDTILLGPESTIDSLTMVSLVVAVEERLEEKTGNSHTLANEKAMSRRSSPFRTVGTLADYIIELLSE